MVVRKNITLVPVTRPMHGKCRIGNPTTGTCDKPVAGEIWWEGEDYCDWACADHLFLLSQTAPNHRYTRWVSN